MYRIGICDDEQEYIAAVETKVLAYFGTRSDYCLFYGVHYSTITGVIFLESWCHIID